MKLKQVLLATTFIAAFALTTSAKAALVGAASAYNVLVFNDFSSSNSDTEGNIAAGGNVSLTNYSVASKINGTDAKLVTGGQVNASNGGVGNDQNGSIYASSVSLNSFTANGGTYSQNQVDFSSAQTEYQNLSTAWSLLAANGNASESYGSLYLTGNDDSLNVFSLDADAISNTSSVYINAAAGSTVLINVSGSGQVFQNGQVFLNGIDPSSVIYNFYEATTLSLLGSKDPQGSVLAAFADVTGGYGQMNGQLIANSYSGNTEFHNYLFNGTIDTPPVSAVPLPATIWLLGPVVGLFGYSRRKNTRRKRHSPSA